MSFMKDEVILTKEQVDKLFGMLRKDGFHFEDQKNGKIKVFI